MKNGFRRFIIGACLVFALAGLAVLLVPDGRKGNTMPGPCRQAVSNVLGHYFVMGRALAGDDAVAAFRAEQNWESAVAEMNDVVFVSKSPQKADWELARKNLLDIPKYTKRADLIELRAHFAGISNSMMLAVALVGHTYLGPVQQVYCGMAFNNTGASWLQCEGPVRNPYFGKEMLECGEVRQVFPPAR